LATIERVIKVMGISDIELEITICDFKLGRVTPGKSLCIYGTPQEPKRRRIGFRREKEA
jgi:hypothetical protein